MDNLYRIQFQEWLIIGYAKAFATLQISMRFQLKSFFVVICCICCFLGGWQCHKSFTSRPQMTVVHWEYVCRVKGNLAMIDVGEEYGMTIGDKVDFFRGGEWIGSGNISNVTRDASAVEFSTEKHILVGDMAQVIKPHVPQ